MAHKFSPAFTSALIGMSIITHAYAEPTKITQEEIERIYIDEVKLPGKTLQCFQGGKQIIHEIGLREFEENEDRMSATRLDNSQFEVRKSQNLTCTIITRKAAE